MTGYDVTTRDVEDAMARLKQKAVCAFNFRIAYERGVPYKNTNHGIYIVPVKLINDELGYDGKTLLNGVGPVLRELGWSRCTRQLYEHSKVVKAISCWETFDK